MPHITVCLCTYQRPEMLRRLLDDISHQVTHGRFSVSVVVTDNDPAESGRKVATAAAERLSIPIAYSTEPRRSIAHARNKSLEGATGEFIAFIDDDEFPERDWLFQMFEALNARPCAGVLGPVRPYYPEGTPDWVRNGGFFERPENATGYEMPWTGCRTGNVLFHREIIRGLDPVFSPEFGTGGSDLDFFRRMIGAGHRFLWCNEGAVQEVVPPSRWKRSVLWKRALLRGRNSFRHPQGRWRGIAKAAVAIPLYAIALPFLQLGGHHLFMRYSVKLCDHMGRFMAAFGLEPVKTRNM